MNPSTPAATRSCQNCGRVIDARAEICPQCGVRQPVRGGSFGVATPSGRNRLAAGLFAIFLGGLGIHKFYLGKTGQGILYLLFFWTLIPALVGFVEGILYLASSDADFAAKYG